jgi:hypothetical protein
MRLGAFGVCRFVQFCVIKDTHNAESGSERQKQGRANLANYAIEEVSVVLNRSQYRSSNFQ